jgi:hypothetical protein
LVGLIAAGTRRPFWLGESGALFLGLLLAGLFVNVAPTTPTPLSLAVVLPLAAIPLLNMATVTINRLQRRRPLTQRRPDGFPHRLRAMGLSWPAALGVLGGLQAAVAATAVLADRGFVPLALPVVVAAVVSFGLLVSARAGRVHKHKAAGTSLVSVWAAQPSLSSSARWWRLPPWPY